MARAAAAEIAAREELELLREPDLSVVALRRRGWAAADYEAWSAKLLADQVGFVVPTSVDGEPATRIAIVNPRTTVDDIRIILDSLR